MRCSWYLAGVRFADSVDMLKNSRKLLSELIALLVGKRQPGKDGDMVHGLAIYAHREACSCSLYGPNVGQTRDVPSQCRTWNAEKAPVPALQITSTRSTSAADGPRSTMGTSCSSRVRFPSATTSTPSSSRLRTKPRRPSALASRRTK